MQKFDEAEQQIANLLGAPGPACPPVDVLTAAGQGVLPAEAEAKVQRHLASCALCTILLADLQTLPESPFTEAESRKIAATLPVLAATPSRQFPLQRFLAVAAVLFVCVAGWLTLRSSKQKAPATAQAKQPQASAAIPPVQVAILEISLRPLPPPASGAALQTRGASHGSNPSLDELLPAFNAYNHAEYGKAAERFRQLSQSYPKSGTVALYLGVSELISGREQQAGEALKVAMNTPDSATQEAAEWYEAIALEHTDPGAARALLQKLCAHQQSAYSTPACKAGAAGSAR